MAREQTSNPRAGDVLAVLARQFLAYVGVSLAALAVHYALLAALVETGRAEPVPAALAGYLAGAVVSYGLNRRLTYASDRPHAEATWRFGVVAAIGFGLTWLIMAGLTRGFGLPYLAAQGLATGVVVFWNFLGHRVWTFAGRPVAVLSEEATGMR
ncbi:GtrA family protein [Methylobacterium terricola]|uniref:GtrA family protein n=1 Tax=Methylobacterium terricola TaxID=2583531 RepID=UPI001FE7AF23|nr:GtrA family protein [Methylobacterium terricola]